MAARTATSNLQPATSIDVFSDVAKPCAALGRRDRALKTALAAIGKPHIRRRPGGFAGLFRIIVEQQVSVPSAQAIWARCNLAYPAMSPAAVLLGGESSLRAAGLSGPKASYVIALSEAVQSGLDLASLDADDLAASQTLQSLKGIGPWTAAIYLLFCEGRADLWPPGDVALQYAYGAALGGGKHPARELDLLAQNWAPWRGLAAHILWTYYAHLKGRVPI